MPETFYRAFGGQMEIRSAAQGGDGRTVYGAAVPFDLPTRINDSLTEAWDRGAFDHQMRAIHRVPLYHLHSVHGGTHVGHLTMARADPKHLYVEARVSKTRAGDDYLAMAEDGSLPEFSVGFDALPGGTQVRSGVAWRVKANLNEVAGVPDGAFGEHASLAGVRSVGGVCPTCGHPQETRNLHAAQRLLAGLPKL